MSTTLGCLTQRRDARLVEQHVDEVLLRGEVLVDELHHDELLETGRTALQGELHLGHPTLADPGDQLVAPKPGRTVTVHPPARTRATSVTQCDPFNYAARGTILV